MKALIPIALFLLVALPVQAVTWQGTGGTYTGTYTNTYGSAYGGSYSNYGSTYGYTQGWNVGRQRSSYTRHSMLRWGRSHDWQPGTTYTWGGNQFQVRSGYNYGSQTFTFSNPRHQSRYNSFCATHPTHWGC